MKAEIGFAFDDDAVTKRRLRMTIHASSTTEATLLKAFAFAMDWTFSETSFELIIEEPNKP